MTSRKKSPVIEHGTLKGWRQHRRRNDAPCMPCVDAKRDHDRAEPGGTASPNQQAWNKGKTGQSRPAEVSPVVERCTVDGCGADADQPRPGPGTVRVHVHGSTEPARWYCRGHCAAVGHALAELRAIGGAA